MKSKTIDTVDITAKGLSSYRKLLEDDEFLEDTGDEGDPIEDDDENFLIGL